MILPPRMSRSSRRRPAGLYPDKPDWHTFAIGACAFLAFAAACIFVVARLGS